MNTAEQLKAFYTTVDKETGSEQIDYAGLCAEAEIKAVDENQDYDNETTEYDFVDGSVLVMCNGDVNTYGSRQ